MHRVFYGIFYGLIYIDTPLDLQEILFVLNGYNMDMWLWCMRTKLYTHLTKPLCSINPVLNPDTFPEIAMELSLCWEDLTVHESAFSADLAFRSRWCIFYRATIADCTSCRLKNKRKILFLPYIKRLMSILDDWH